MSNNGNVKSVSTNLGQMAGKVKAPKKGITKLYAVLILKYA
jgi:hypothetical protein